MSNPIAAFFEICAAFLAAADLLLASERLKSGLRLFLVTVMGGALFLMSLGISFLLLAIALLFFSVARGWLAAAIGISLAVWFLFGGRVRDWFGDWIVFKPIDWMLRTDRPRLFAWFGFVVFVAIQISK